MEGELGQGDKRNRTVPKRVQGLVLFWRRRLWTGEHSDVWLNRVLESKRIESTGIMISHFVLCSWG